MKIVLKKKLHSVEKNRFFSRSWEKRIISTGSKEQFEKRLIKSLKRGALWLFCYYPVFTENQKSLTMPEKVKPKELWSPKAVPFGRTRDCLLVRWER